VVNLEQLTFALPGWPYSGVAQPLAHDQYLVAFGFEGYQQTKMRRKQSQGMPRVKA